MTRRVHWLGRSWVTGRILVGLNHLDFLRVRSGFEPEGRGFGILPARQFRIDPRLGPWSHDDGPAEPDSKKGDIRVCHISYSRLAMRVIENHTAKADELIAQHGEPMAQLLGRCDSLDSPTGFDFSKTYETFNNAKI